MQRPKYWKMRESKNVFFKKKVYDYEVLDRIYYVVNGALTFAYFVSVDGYIYTIIADNLLSYKYPGVIDVDTVGYVKIIEDEIKEDFCRSILSDNIDTNLASLDIPDIRSEVLREILSRKIPHFLNLSSYDVQIFKINSDRNLLTLDEYNNQKKSIYTDLSCYPIENIRWSNEDINSLAEKFNIYMENRFDILSLYLKHRKRLKTGEFGFSLVKDRHARFRFYLFLGKFQSDLSIKSIEKDELVFRFNKSIPRKYCYLELSFPNRIYSKSMLVNALEEMKTAPLEKYLSGIILKTSRIDVHHKEEYFSGESLESLKNAEEIILDNTEVNFKTISLQIGHYRDTFHNAREIRFGIN